MEVVGDHCNQLAHCVRESQQDYVLCDVSLRSRNKSGNWEAWPCHSSILAALSPVLRTALAEHTKEEEVVVVSEVEGGALLSLLYTGAAECNSRAMAGELWSALAELGVEGAISLSKLIGRPAPRGPVMHIMLGVDTDGKNTNYEEELSPYADTSLHSYPSATEETPEEIAGKVQGPEAHLVCSECNERFSSDTSLRAHMADLHTIVQCPQCGLEVYGSTNLINHMSDRHPAPDTDATVKSEFAAPTCTICRETFVTNQALKYHLYKHSGLKPFQCTVCQTSFRTPSTLKSHVEVQHTESKHRCNICGLKSSTSGKLKIHMRTHTNEKPYHCTFCSANFRQLSVLRVHEFTHTKKSRHKCDRCGHFFPTKNRLIGHRSKPICVNRARVAPIHRRYHNREHTKSEKLMTTEEDLSEAGSSMDRVTYLIHTEPVANELPLQQLGGQEEEPGTSYETQMASYQEPALDTLETGEIPVLVDNLPVIIQADMDQSREEMVKHQEIMFSL